MFLRYGDYEQEYDGLPTIKVDGPIGDASFAETWIISGTIHRDMPQLFSKSSHYWEHEANPVELRLHCNAVARTVRNFLRFSVTSRRHKRRGNHRGRYYKNLNGRSK